MFCQFKRRKYEFISIFENLIRGTSTSSISYYEICFIKKNKKMKKVSILYDIGWASWLYCNFCLMRKTSGKQRCFQFHVFQPIRSTFNTYDQELSRFLPILKLINSSSRLRECLQHSGKHAWIDPEFDTNEECLHFVRSLKLRAGFCKRFHKITLFLGKKYYLGRTCILITLKSPVALDTVRLEYFFKHKNWIQIHWKKFIKNFQKNFENTG